MKKIILLVFIALLSLSIVNGYNGDICNETNSPCGGGCNSTDLSSMYLDVTDFNSTYGNITGWDVSCISNFYRMFENSDFNQDLSSWNMTSATSTARMFKDTSFNHDISPWDVSSVIYMNAMFSNITSFNQDISSWNTGLVQTMYYMFSYATSFNQDISPWNTSSVISMNNMFEEATSFNQDISPWDITSITIPYSMDYMFKGVTLSTANYDNILSEWSQQNTTLNISFDGGNSKYLNSTARSILTSTYSWNVTDGGLLSCSTCSEICSPCGGGCTATSFQNMYVGYDWVTDSNGYGDISNFNTSCILSMSGAFANSNFNQDIGNYDTSNVVNMGNMFNNASVFNQDIGNFDTGSVIIMGDMFYLASLFNQDISSWDLGNTQTTDNMFHNATSFNQDISFWDMSSNNNMNSMFEGATSFDQDLGNWDMTFVTDIQEMFKDITLSTINYDNILSGWSQQGVNFALTFDGGNSQYTNTTARGVLTDTYLWSITDGGLYNESSNIPPIILNYSPDLLYNVTSGNTYINFSFTYNDTENDTSINWSNGVYNIPNQSIYFNESIIYNLSVIIFDSEYNDTLDWIINYTKIEDNVTDNNITTTNILIDISEDTKDYFTKIILFIISIIILSILILKIFDDKDETKIKGYMYVFLGIVGITLYLYSGLVTELRIIYIIISIVAIIINIYENILND